MTEIDLDLIKLRATVRGWRFEQFDDPEQIHIECKYGGWLMFQSGKRIRREHPWSDTPAHKRIEATLTAPRWTLARLLSEPPEGWRSEGEVMRWGGNEVGSEVSVFVGTASDGALFVSTVVDNYARATEVARLAERYKAAAELALILAEIQP